MTLLFEKSKIIKEKFDLIPHPEGGYYREYYRDEKFTQTERGIRSYSTAIYYLLEGEDFSGFHKIQSDELWHFYSGGVLLIHCLEEGVVTTKRLGPPESNAEFSQVIPAGVWFAAELEDKNSFAFVGCTVSPGFDFADFTMAKKEELLALCSSPLVQRLSR